MDGDKKKIGILSSIEVRYGSCYPMVKLYKKDGSVREKETKIWMWNQKILKKTKN
jgi:hypothetical protein